MTKRLITSVCLALLTIGVFAQSSKRASGSFDYVIPEEESLSVAREQALKYCRIRILADAFGTTISSTELSQIEGGKDRYMQIAESQVKGEWIRDIGEPEITKSVKNNHFVLTVTMTGEIREITKAKISLRANLMRNGGSSMIVSDEFKNRENFYLSFQTPKDGYLLVYCVDASMAMCLLPYFGQNVSTLKVKARKDYLFFSLDHVYDETEFYVIQPYEAYTEKEAEQNRLFVIFSPNEFTRPAASSVSGVEMLPYQDFQKWLSRARQQDKSMVVEEIVFTIHQ